MCWYLNKSEILGELNIHLFITLAMVQETYNCSEYVYLLVVFIDCIFKIHI